MHKHRDGLTERAALWWGERLVAHRLVVSCVAVRVVELPIVLLDDDRRTLANYRIQRQSTLTLVPLGGATAAVANEAPDSDATVTASSAGAWPIEVRAWRIESACCPAQVRGFQIEDRGSQ